MQGFLAPTDFEWFQFLAGIEQLDEVNFWRPNNKALKAISPNEPFLFKMKSPHNAIGGFGIFVRYSYLPDWLAWESFGFANGASNLDEMRRNIGAYKNRTGNRETHSGSIGCIMLANPVFFPQELWIRQPADWERNIVQGKTYDLTIGEGKRIWTECLARAQGMWQYPGQIEEQVARYGDETTITPRLGQGTFRVLVTEAYQRTCAMTTEHSLPVLEAAHIKPYALGGTHSVNNGLLLRSDVHRLFDKGYVTVAPDYRIEVSNRLKDEFHNGKAYYPYHGSKLLLPRDPTNHPNARLLEYHQNEIYLG
ncbi:MAG: HNH endonuclease [Acidobacteria bacterium]|nr:HNH endonuclease [Acidobacteriota bacterium]